MVANIFHIIYGISNLLVVSLLFLVSLYRYIEDIKTIMQSINPRRLFLIVKKKKVYNWFDM